MTFNELYSASTPWTGLRFYQANSTSIGSLYVSVIANDTVPQVVQNSIFGRSYAKWGGAVLVEEARMTFLNVTWIENDAEYGAALYVHNGGDVFVQNSFFRNNSASDGGAAYMYGGKLRIESSLFDSNFASDTGGAIATSQVSEMAIYDTEFTDNAAGGQGGAIYSVNPLEVERCRFLRNLIVEDGDGHPTISYFMGSAIMVSGDEDTEQPLVVVRDCLFDQNYAQPTIKSYGTLSLIERSILIERCQFIDGTAWKGAGVYLQNPLDGTRLVDTSFRSGLGLIGAGLYVTSYSHLHNMTIERCTFNANDGRAFHADEFERKMIAGAGIATNGPLDIEMSDSIFMDNTCIVSDSDPEQANDTIYGCSILFEDQSDEYYTSSLVVSNCTFHDNYAAGGTAVRAAAIGILVVEEMRIEIYDSDFKNNTCDCKRSGCFAYGPALTTSFASGVTPKKRVTVTMEDCSVVGHYSKNAAIWLEDSTSFLRRVLIKQNVGSDIVGGVQVFNGGAAFGASDREYTFQDCIFDANLALQIVRPLSESGYHDLMIYSHGDTPMVWTYFVGNNRFLNHRANISVLFGSSITLSRNSGLQVIPGDDPVTLQFPPVLQFGKTTLDLRLSAVTIDCLKLWWSSGEDYGFNTVLVGDFDIVALRSNSFHHSAVVGTGTSNSRFILRDRSYTVGSNTPKLFSNLTVVNEGRMEHYACNITLDNAVVINQPKSQWVLPLYNPASFLIGPGRFQNLGNMTMATGIFKDIQLTLMPSSQLTYQLTNFWKPSELSLIGSSTLALGGGLVVDSNPMREFSEANNQQIFTIIRTPSFTGAFSLSDMGGYKMRLVTSPREISVAVINFYPYRVQQNEDGSRLTLSFSRATNSPGAGGCAALFDAITVSSFSSGSECSWVSDSSLLVKTTKHNGRVSLVGGVIRDLKDPMFQVPSITLPVTPSSFPLKPQIVLVAPSVHPACSDLSLDASPSFYLGEPTEASFSWSVSGNAGLQAFLDAVPRSSPKIAIPANFFDQRQRSTLAFSLSVINTMGQTSVYAFQIQTVPDVVPIVVIEGPVVRDIVSAYDTQLNARVALPECVTSAFSNQRFVRQWQVSSISPVNCTLQGTSEFTLSIPRSCLLPAARYTFTFSVFPETAPDLRVSQSVVVSTVYSSIGLQSIGMSGLADAAKAVLLEVSIIDPDAIYWKSPTVFAWQVLACPGRGQLASISSSELASSYLKRQLKASASKGGNGGSNDDTPIFDPENDVVCERPNGDRFLIPPLNASKINFPSGFLPEGEFLFGVTARRGDRYASDLIYLNVSRFSPSVAARTVSIRTRTGTLKTLAQERLVLKGYVDGLNSIPSGLELTWADEQTSSYFVSNSSSTNFSAPSYSILICCSLDLLTPLSNINLVLRPDALKSGNYYAVRVDVSDSSGALVGSTRRILGVNSAPSNGILSVSTASVKQFSRVSLSAVGWVDADTPLRYVFSIVSASGQEIFLSEPLDVPSISFVMPFVGSVTAKARIIDSGGAEATASISISSQVSALVTIPDVKTRFDLSIKLGDFRSANQELFALMIASNIARSPAVSLREEMLQTLSTYVSSSGIAATYVPVLVKSLQLVTDFGEGVSPTVAMSALNLLESAVHTAVTSESVAASLVFSNSILSRYSAQQFLSTVANVAGQLRAISSTDSQANTRILNVLEKLLLLQTQFSVEDEFASALGDPSSSLNLTSIVLSPRTVGEYGGRVVVPIANITLGLNLTNVGSSGVSINVITWAEGTFPGKPLNSVSFGKVITAVVSGSNVSDIDVDFDDTKIVSSGQTKACAAYNENSQSWDTSSCYTAVQASRVTCRCKTDGHASSRISITVLLGAEALLTPGEKTSEINIGAAVGISLGVCAVAAIVVAVTVRVIRYKRLHKSKSSAMEKLKALAGSQIDSTKQRLLSEPPKLPSLPTTYVRNASPWKRAQPSDKSGLLDDSEIVSEDVAENDGIGDSDL